MVPSCRTTTTFLCVAGIAGLLTLGCLKSRQIRHEIQRAWTPITDISRYEELLAGVRELGLANHFPDSVPHTAVAFNYTPHFLQGPLVLQLKCQVPEREWGAVMNSIAKQRTEAPDANRPVDPTAPRPYDYTASDKTSVFQVGNDDSAPLLSRADAVKWWWLRKATVALQRPSFRMTK